MGKQIFSNKGFSIIEGLIAAGVVAVSILAIGAMVGRHADMSNKTQAKQELPGVGTDILNRSRSVMLDSVNVTTKQKTEGLCKLLQPTEVKPGVVPINLILSREIAPIAKWRAAFEPEWQISSYNSDGHGRVTFKLAPTPGVNTLVDAKGIDQKSLKVDVNIGARTIDPSANKEGLFAEVPSSQAFIDAKKAVFMVVVKTNFTQVSDSGVRDEKQSEAKEIISVLDIGACEIKDASGKVLALSPAGTGTGDPAGRTIYNDAEFVKEGKDAFQIVMAANEVTQGIYKSGRLSADREKNVVAACTETKYRCPKASPQIREYRPYINVSSNINYFPINRYTSRKITPVRVTPRMQLVDETGADYVTSKGMTAHYSTTAASEYKRHTDNLLYLVKVDGSLDLTAPLRVGELDNRILTTLNGAQDVCRDVCTIEKPKHLKTILSLTTPDLIDPVTKGAVTESGDAKMPLHCTMCFVKGCTRMGLETFGPIAEMPPEPLDAQMPECAAEEGRNKQILPFVNRGIAGVNNDQCISAKISGGKLVYSTRNCSESLPVMCFAFGEYVLARSLGSADASARSASFADAQQVCREMGRESHPVQVLREGFLQQDGSIANLAGIPVSNNRYTFLNLAKAGSFVAPQSDEDMDYAVKTLETRSKVAKDGGEFWVALKTQNGVVIADIPKASVTNPSDEQHLIYYSAGGKQTHTTVTTTPYSHVTAPASGETQAYVIFNHVKYRGVVPAARSQATPLHFLCMKPSDHTFFISVGSKTNFAEGGATCEASGGLFIAPHTPMGWVQALMTVGKHMDFSSFADPTLTNQYWIAFEGNMAPALQGQLGMLGYKDSSLDLSHQYVNGDGAFVEKRKTQQEQSISPVPASAPFTEWVDNPNLKVKFACFNALRKSVVLRAAKDGCDGSEKRLFEADLKKPIYSMVWVMSKNGFGLGNDEFIKVAN